VTLQNYGNYTLRLSTQGYVDVMIGLVVKREWHATFPVTAGMPSPTVVRSSHAEPDSGLSTGVIVAIAVLSTLLLIAVVVTYFCWKRRRSESEFF